MKTTAKQFVCVTTTVDSVPKARKLAGAIVGSRLAACVQYMPIRSIYRWNGRVESAAEQLLVAKTRASAANRLVAYIRKNHSYELPEITIVPIKGGLAGYLAWIDAETKETGRTRASNPCGCEHG